MNNSNKKAPEVVRHRAGAIVNQQRQYTGISNSGQDIQAIGRYPHTPPPTPSGELAYTGRCGGGGEPSPLGISIHKRTDAVWRLGPRGAQSIVKTGVRKKPPKPIKIRGKCGGITRKQIASLKEKLVTLDIKKPHACTFTVPGSSISPEAWRKTWHVFCIRIVRLKLVMLWRVELQTVSRIQPHIHAIIWDPDETHKEGLSAPLLQAWWAVIKTLGPDDHTTNSGQRFQVTNRMSLPEAFERAAQVIPEEPGARSNWFRYCASHATKRKQGQAGWLGRHWGLVGRSRATLAPVEIEGCTFWENCWVLRRLRRLQRARPGKTYGVLGKFSWLGVRADTIKELIQMAKKTVIPDPPEPPLIGGLGLPQGC